MASGVIGPTLGVAQLAATLSGVPFAAGGVMALQMTAAACSQVSVHKQKSAQLIARCTLLLNAINDHSSVLVGMDANAAFDKAAAVLLGVHGRMQRWANIGKVKALINIAQIERDLDKCYADVNHAMEELHLSNPVELLRMQKKSMDMMLHHHATMSETLQQFTPREIERVVQQHISGGNEARELMRLGQEQLINLREEAPVPSASVLTDGRQIDQSPTSSVPASPVATVQNHLEQALLDLHRLAGIPPTIPILNKEVKKTNPVSVRGGPYSQIFEGLWLSKKKVALKTLRLLDEHDPKAQRLQTRFEHEIAVWSKLNHENVLTMLGIVTNMGPIHIVSPWQLDNVRNYRYDNPDANPLNLLSQASKGLEYLHDQQIVHGHLKCTNMLVSEEGIVTLSDFGLTQALTDVVGKSIMITLTNTSAIRWHAPELNESEISTPTMASDIFGFGMSVLELLTMKPPYSHRRRDISVVYDVMEGVLPPRPEEPEAVPWMSDELWETLNRCWKWKPEERMEAKELSMSLQRVSESSTKV